ncbi:DUF803-domain-containing protein [Saccharata proteae CBS 121410]|uniref:DUF803-domain-containing protein n=1 Tax=Saccharata proteae CBS 121410 TaxID=1314787 RepID=A0A9P4HY11_9PEZI|nr:DUF803-domain-containing protein [Saccharata proteae CBS 121410]
MDVAGSVLLESHNLYARNTTSSSDSSSDSRPAVYKVVGIILAISSGLFIGVSFVLKKKGLLKANVKYNEEAGEGYGYLRNWLWWTGMTLMIIGEICNFVAYAFVDAILVTPMGALSVVICAILSAIFLKERLSFVGQIGCFNCIIGSVVIVINAPEQSAVAKIQDMKKLVITPGFLSYAGVIIVGCLIVAIWVAPKYGKKSMLVYISICSLIGGLSVVATQGLGAAIVAQIGGTPQFNQWFLYVLFVFVVATLLTEIIYLNKALNIFNAALVTPTYYVFFTSSTIVTSAVLFQGFKGTAATISTVIMGFLQICAGVVLLQLSKSAKDVPDAAVFTGDLNQVRTVAEQEEHEYEPRADTIRGGAGILRVFSTARQKRELEEVKTIHEEHMEPIGENEQVEWDGLRRRKTVLEPGIKPMQRSKTLHPPLGMSQFPDDESDRGSDDDVHPGFFSRLGTMHRKSQRHAVTHPVPLESFEAPNKSDDRPTLGSHGSTGTTREHVYGLPAGLQAMEEEDTSYRPSTQASHVQWASATPDTVRAKSPASLGVPPTPPPHGGNKRQFSFQNVFGRNREPADSGSAQRPVSSRSANSFVKHKKTATDGATEEERLGLVKGDSNIQMPESIASPPSYSDHDAEGDWHLPDRILRVPASKGSRMVGSSVESARGHVESDDNESSITDDSFDEMAKTLV